MKATFALTVSALLAGAMAAPRNFTTIQASGTYDPAAATAVQTVYPKQHHYAKGRLVDHIWHIVLDTADYSDASNNADIQALAAQGITLTNYYALAQPAQANYLALAGGDTFGLDQEGFVALPSNVSTIAESLENRRVLWAQYVEDQPFTGFPGYEYNGTYTRTKNPFIQFDSVASEYSRLVNLRSLANFEIDYASGNIPQWLLVIPNLNNNGANTDLATSASWVRNFLEPIISDKKKSHRHTFIVTFAAASSTDGPNQVLTLILGDMHPKLRGTTDNTYYDHYSILATTEANWGLPSLGRYDCGANVFEVFNPKVHHKNKEVTVNGNYNSGVLSGYLSSTDNALPFPNLNCEGAGHVGVLSRVKKIWKKASFSYYQWTFHY